ncbi:MAG: aspartyl protease family protein [Vicinamibacterales bacterium]
MRLCVFMFVAVMNVGTNAIHGLDAAGATPFRSAAPGEIVVSVAANGHGPFAFLLDTGSSHSSISESLSRRLGTPLVAQALVTSPIGGRMRTIAALDRMEVGPTATRGVLASVVPDEDLDARGVIDGVIGQDVLTTRRYTIDFQQRRVLWHTPAEPAPPGAASFTLHPAAGVFLVELPQDGPSLYLVPDSGSQGLVLYRRDDRRLPPLRPAGRTRLSTTTSTAEAQTIRVAELRVGQMSFVDVPAVLIDQHHTTSQGDGFLPLHLFERVTFDGPARRLTVR